MIKIARPCSVKQPEQACPLSEALIHTLALLRDIQKERGIALLPPYELDQDASIDFPTQAAATHATLTITQKKFPEFWTLLPERFFEAFAQRTNDAFRTGQKCDALIEWYSFNLEQPVHQMALGTLTNEPRFSPSQTSALVHFVASLLYLTQLRDLGVAVYTKAEITPTDSSRLKNAASSYHAREKLYLGLADDNLRQMIDDAKGTSFAAMAEMDEIVRKIKNGYAKGVLATTPMHEWILVFNREIATLHEALNTTIRKLSEQGEELASQSALGQSLDSDVEHSFASLAGLPLFRGLSESQLRNLLKGARLTDIDKNTPFMSQGDALSRFIIVIDGWVKTTKESADGQESILQIVGKKEALFDMNCLTSSIIPINARTITKCRILSLSLPVLRDLISRNHKLSQNFLSATTVRLQRLVSQYEQITLKNATQRVGWFLVNLHLETGLEGAPLKLPFDKALIASYLNIKPETFSRALQTFKKEGFVIEKDQVILPNIHALCKYCDPEMALRCGRAEAANCAPIQAARRFDGK